MVTVIKKGESKSNIQKALRKIEESTKSGFNAKKFSGTLKLEEEPMDIQKRLRDEWE